MNQKTNNFLFENHIFVKGAREHNLQNIDVEIPRDKLVVITGLSGLGSPPWHLIQFTPKGKDDM